LQRLSEESWLDQKKGKTQALSHAGSQEKRASINFVEGKKGAWRSTGKSGGRGEGPKTPLFDRGKRKSHFQFRREGDPVYHSGPSVKKEKGARMSFLSATGK